MAAQKQPPLTKVVCAYCGTRLRHNQWVYSRFTKNHYCFDLDACRARSKKRKA